MLYVKLLCSNKSQKILTSRLKIPHQSKYKQGKDSGACSYWFFLKKKSFREADVKVEQLEKKLEQLTLQLTDEETKNDDLESKNKELNGQLEEIHKQLDDM